MPRLPKASVLFFLIALAPAVAAEQIDPAKHWSFQPMTNQPAPVVRDPAWSRTDIDRFILSRLEAAGLTPNTDAQPQILLRRVFFDLIGLPPTLDDIETWTPRLAADPDRGLPELLDHLIARHEFGQRWGKHWLDVARFAESAGQSRNISYRFAWPYRNWVIDAFNDDLPFDRFIVEQIAGDLLPYDSRDQRESQLTGTGFLLVGPKLLNEPNTSLVYRMGVVDDQIDTTFRAFMGLTVACARCHEHFFDPISTNDYYALAGIFRSTKNLAGVKSNNNTIDNGLYPLGKDGQAIIDAIAAAEEHLTKVTPIFTKARLAQAALENEIKDAKAASAAAEEIAKLEKALEAAIILHKAEAKNFQDARKAVPEPPPSIMAALEGDLVADCELFAAGDVGQPKDPISRGTLAFLCETAPMDGIAANESGRLQLAEWLADPRNPLTARVFVNRVWSHLFGVGLVDTPDNFGALGASPSHPELLDHLASEFVANGSSVKDLIRTMMISRVYRISSDHSAAAYSIDPGNRLHWRMNRRRLEGEIVRDSMLHAAGRLDSAHAEGSLVSELGTFEMNTEKRAALGESYAQGLNRSVYLPAMRSGLPDMMRVFDAADPSLVVGRRDVTTVAPQALFLMNNEFARMQARHAAQQLLAPGGEPGVGAAFRRLLGRDPDESERRVVDEFVATMGDAPPLEIWTEICHGLMASGEFRSVY